MHKLFINRNKQVILFLNIVIIIVSSIIIEIILFTFIIINRFISSYFVLHM